MERDEETLHPALAQVNGLDQKVHRVRGQN